MQLAQAKNSASLICFGIGNLSHFPVVKRLRELGGCLGDNHTFSFECRL